MNADRRSAYTQAHLGLEDALRHEFQEGVKVVQTESIAGATRFAGERAGTASSSRAPKPAGDAARPVGLC